MINLELPQPDPFTNLNVTLLLESLTSGEVVASVREFPDCQVKAETREADAQIQATFLERLKNIEAISGNVPIQASEPTWMKLAGVFKDDSDLVAMAIAQIQATFLERLKNIEAISGNVPIQASEPTWMKFAGVFKDDPDFVAIMESIRAERTSDDESEVDPSYYL